LPDLLDSGDIKLNLEKCFAKLGVSHVILSVHEPAEGMSSGPGPLHKRVEVGEGPRFVLTLPVGKWKLTVSPSAEAGAAPPAQEFDVTIKKAGEDVKITASCDPEDPPRVRYGMLPVPFEPPNVGVDLNDREQVLGSHCKIWTQQGGVQETGVDSPCVLGGKGALDHPARHVEPLEGDLNASISAISRNGSAAGHSTRQDSDRGYIWDGQTREILAEFTGTFRNWAIEAINDSGQVVGSAQLEERGPTLAAFLEGSTPRPLPLAEGYVDSFGRYLTEEGCVAGGATREEGGGVPAYWCGDEQHYYTDVNFEQFIGVSSNGYLLGGGDSSRTYLSTDGETFTEVGGTFEVEQEDDDVFVAWTAKVVAVNSSGVMLAHTKLLLGETAGSALLVPIDDNEVDLRIEKSDLADDLYRIRVVNLGIRPLSSLEITINLSHPIEYPDLPVICSAAPEGGPTTITCSYLPEETLEPDSIEQFFLTLIPTEKDVDLVITGRAEMTTEDAETVDDVRVLSTRQ
jgi:hypothetical protein